MAAGVSLVGILVLLGLGLSLARLGRTIRVVVWAALRRTVTSMRMLAVLLPIRLAVIVTAVGPVHEEVTKQHQPEKAIVQNGRPGNLEHQDGRSGSKDNDSDE